MRSNLLATVMSRYESAKVRAKGDSDRFEVLSVVEPADVGARTAMTTLAGIGLVAGLLAAIISSFIRDYILRQSAAGRLDPIFSELRRDKIRAQRMVRFLRPAGEWGPDLLRGESGLGRSGLKPEWRRLSHSNPPSSRTIPSSRKY
jgi:hypothetical protein